MSQEAIFAEAADSVINGNADAAHDVAKRALAAGIDPVLTLNEGFIAGIRQIGDMFGQGEVALPELILASEAMQAAMAILDEVIREKGSGAKKATMIIATVEGDIHDIGKGIVATLLKAHGIEVIDLGRDVPTETIIEKALEVNADIIGTSALITTTMMRQKKLEDELRSRNIRDRFKTMVGGAPCTQRWAEKIGADAYAEDAAEAVTKALQLLESK